MVTSSTIPPLNMSRLEMASREFTMTTIKTWIALLLGLAMTGTALAQTPAPLIEASGLATEIAGAAAKVSQGGNAPGNAGGVVRVQRSGPSSVPKQFAARYPAAQRAESQKIFDGLLQAWPKVEQHFRLEANDLVAAAAMFTIGAYQGYYNRTLSEDDFRALVKQFRPAISGNAAIAGAPDADKRELFEQMVILGMFMDRAQSQLQKTPNAQVEAQLKQAARGYLEQFLQADPETIEITRNGLTMKGRRGAAPAAVVNGSPAAPVNAKRALAEKDIETVLYSVEQSYRGANYVATDHTFLLLKDGSARSDVPGAAPADFDLAADRAQNPRRWGQWRKVGGEYQIKIGNGGFTTPSPQVARLPGRKGQRLDKNFTASTGENHGTVGFWQTRGLRLSKDGTFKRASSGGGGGTAGHGDTAASVYSTHNDKGGETAIATPNIGVSTSKRTGITDSDLTGTYEIDGYTLTLRYNNGKVSRGFFYISHHGKAIWFEGRQLSNFD
jgi:hypothetical protein